MNSSDKLILASAGMGILCAITWITAYDSFNMASFMLYQNSYIIPAIATAIIMTTALGCLLGVGYLERFAVWTIELIEADLKK